MAHKTSIFLSCRLLKNVFALRSLAGVSHTRSCTTALPNEKNNSEDVFNKQIEAADASHKCNSDKGDQFGNLKVSWEKRRSTKVQRAKQADVRKKNRLVPNKTVHLDQNDASNKFGDLNGNSTWMSPIEDDVETSADSTVFYPERKFRSAEAYLREMIKLVKQKKLKEALELFPDMKRHGIRPIHPNYTFMIGACGRAGYTEMAFALLRQMTVRGQRPSPATLTGLFNSCAECPFPEQGLKQIGMLREKIVQKNWLMNISVYHALIKAYGKCGDLESAFEVVDEMIKAGIAPTTSTYCSLLISCISDKEAGFTHAIEVWRKMRSKKVSPSLYLFNLLLRATRDCGIGPEETSALLLQHWSSYNKRPYGLNEQRKLSPKAMLQLPNPEFAIGIESGKEASEIPNSSAHEKTVDVKELENHSSNRSEDLENVETSCSAYDLQCVPNILSLRPQKGPVVFDLLSIKTASDRLALLGRAEGFLDLMKHFEVPPDIKTFTMLMDNLPGDEEAEEELISLMDLNKVVPDTDFFNMLIKRRNLRKDFKLARSTLLLINKYNLSPDIVTFGVLALGCTKRKHGLALLRDMEKLGYHFNMEIIGALIHNACRAFDFEYLEMLLSKIRDAGLSPEKSVFEKIEATLAETRQSILDKEQGKEVEDRFQSQGFLDSYKMFTQFYSEWLQTVSVMEEAHPWDQYKTDIIYRRKHLEYQS